MKSTRTKVATAAVLAALFRLILAAAAVGPLILRSYMPLALVRTAGRGITFFHKPLALVLLIAIPEEDRRDRLFQWLDRKIDRLLRKYPWLPPFDRPEESERKDDEIDPKN